MCCSVPTKSHTPLPPWAPAPLTPVPPATRLYALVCSLHKASAHPHLAPPLHRWSAWRTISSTSASTASASCCGSLALCWASLTVSRHPQPCCRPTRSLVVRRGPLQFFPGTPSATCFLALPPAPSILQPRCPDTPGSCLALEWSRVQPNHRVGRAWRGQELSVCSLPETPGHSHLNHAGVWSLVSALLAQCPRSPSHFLVALSFTQNPHRIHSSPRYPLAFCFPRLGVKLPPPPPPQACLN